MHSILVARIWNGGRRGISEARLAARIFVISSSFSNEVNMKLFLQQVFCVSIIAILSMLPFSSQSQTFGEYCFGGARNEDTFNDVKNADDGSIVLGYTTSQDDSFHFFVVKINEEGNEEWSQTYGGIDVNRIGEKILVLTDGYLLAGTTEPVDQFGTKDIYLIRIDQLGNIIWEQTYGVSDDDIFGDITIDHNGNFAVVGGSVLNETVGEDIFLTVIDESGTELWTQYYGSDRADEASCVITDSEGNYLLGSTLDGNATVISVGENSPVINWEILPSGNDTDLRTVNDISYFPDETQFLVLGSNTFLKPMASIIWPDGTVASSQIYEDIFDGNNGYLSSASLGDETFNVLANRPFNAQKVVTLDLDLSTLGSLELADSLEINSIETTLNGNIIASGSIFDQSRDALITSYNIDGSNLWQRTLGQMEKINNQLGFAIEATLDSGFVLAGSQNIYKLNKSLEIEWVTEFSQSSDPWSIVQSPDLSYYLLNTIDNSRFLQKLDNNGTPVWEIELSDELFVFPIFGKVVNLNDGNLLTLYTGRIEGESDDVAILKKISPDGEVLWSKNLILSDRTRAYSLVKTSDNNFVICGVIRDSGADYQPFLAKIDQDGNLIWYKDYEIEESFSRLFTRLYEAENSDLVMIGTASNPENFPVLFRTDADGNELDRKYLFEQDYRHYAYDIAPVTVDGNNQIAFVSTGSFSSNNIPSFSFKSREARITMVDQNFDVITTSNFGEGSAPVFFDMAVALDGKIAALGFAGKGTSSKVLLVSTTADGIGTKTFDLDAIGVTSVFPNPSKGIINVHLKNDKRGILEIKLINSLGQSVWREHHTKDGHTFNQSFDFSFLKDGQFFISISQDGQTWSRQWIKTAN